MVRLCTFISRAWYSRIVLLIVQYMQWQDELEDTWIVCSEGWHRRSLAGRWNAAVGGQQVGQSVCVGYCCLALARNRWGAFGKTGFQETRREPYVS